MTLTGRGQPGPAAQSAPAAPAGDGVEAPRGPIGRSAPAAPSPSTTAAVVGAAAGALLFVLTHRAMTDDAMITVTYARTLAETGTWGVVPGLPANTQTSPLNLGLLALATLVTGSPVIAVGLVLVAALAATGWAATRLAERIGISPWSGVPLVLLLAACPVLVGTVGLETHLAVAVLVSTAWAAEGRRTLVTGVLVGLAVLTRPDLLVPALVLALAVHPSWRRGAVVTGIAAVVAAPWHLVAWFVLGGLVPDTVWMKTMTDGPRLLSGVVDFWGVYSPAGTVVSAAPVVVALLCALGWVALDRRRPVARVVVVLVAAGWAHLLALAAIDADGASWYYGPLVACSCAAVALTAGAVGTWFALELAACTAAAALAGIAAYGPVPWTWLPVVANVAESRQYAAVGGELAGLTGGQAVQGPGEVGGLAFHAGVPVLDALSDPARTADVLAREAASSGPVRRTLLGWSTAHRRASPVVPLRWALVFGPAPERAGRVARAWTVSTPVRGTDTLSLVARW